MIELGEINKLVLKINELEDSKFAQPPEKRIELGSRQVPLLRELYGKLGDMICTF